MAAYFNLILQGTVYFAARRSAEDDDMLQMYSSKLLGPARDIESTFDTLYSRVARNWQQRDDVLTPFNDRRWSHVRSVWSFDLDSDILRLDKKDRNLWVPLNLIRQRYITISDFEPYEPPPTIAKHALQSMAVYPTPCWRIKRKEIDLQRIERHKAFISKILADFAFQWRHVLNGRYNNSTFRKFAYAIISIVTLDFTVEEVTLSRQGLGGFLVWIDRLPEWDFASRYIVRVGETSIVICQHAPHAVALIGEDFRKRILSTPDSEDRSFTYLILSVRELILYRMNNQRPKYTEPMRLFDGTHPPPDEAIELLLQATQTSTSALGAPLRKLPVELQDAILDNVSAGPIESARVGCLLDAGSSFSWKCGKRNIEREEGHRHRTPWTPVESHICFGGYRSGIAYK
ncbi:hypothetical protein BU16DRAFT_582471 [Lophium mytilinum]|uniref:Uncharacterized protein n=1 Tax=Lophium mytilinum TaxID=390894 RepID=A0A6A6QQX9_9PEZI|nr:hypothetical protein BU16DRAFT_582471 [Lophium mytilinum]